MRLMLLGGSTITPALVLLWYIYSRDQFPEPRALRLKTFLLGLFCCFPALVVRATVEQSFPELTTPGALSTAWWRALFSLAIPQELLKFLLLYLYARRNPAFNEPLDGVIYGATISLGFATLENMTYVGEFNMDIAVVRALLAVPVQAATGVVMGAYVGREHFTEDPFQSLSFLARGLGGAILLNALFNASLLTHQVSFASLAIAVNALGLCWAWRLFKALREEQDRLFHVLKLREERQAADDRDGPPSAPEPEIAWAAVPREPPRELSWWALTKLVLGGVGLSICGLLWLGTLQLFCEEFQRNGLGGALLSALFGVLFVDLVPTWLFWSLFRSGLRGPFVPSTVS
ncbi:PrsW family intramembrane metalloprotease [Archangium violaceum]|uniref:PrsW family intramembrane metalloprotease n=1 Tax=Archangium violaceum TaxID=83451 RepID=UPI00194FBA77|nr:PrsW family intramembrane metalloprotease [Archangium violaceum]QRN96761.1 PrsW family intramembrane metalloprotease [Archangium violaceum]